MLFQADTCLTADPCNKIIPSATIFLFPVTLTTVRTNIVVMLIKSYSSALHGIQATTITIEVNIFLGIRFFIVGQADYAVKKSLQRIGSVLATYGYKWPRHRTVINLAPADNRFKKFRPVNKSP